MKQEFSFYFQEAPESPSEEAKAVRSAQMVVRYDSKPTVFELTSAFREFLKAAGYITE